MNANGRYGERTPRFVVVFLFGLVALLAVGTCATPAVASPGDPVITTTSGRLQGVVGATMIQYLGIPYALAPVGALRWTPPSPISPWTGIFQATTFGNVCPQMDLKGNVIGNEDCLFLNVYAPLGKTRLKPTGRAVMVWIHGGGLNKGAGSDFDPTPLVEGGDVIVVTINYRLGVLGFLAQQALDAEGHDAGNYGFMDQQLALHWVNDNIAALGGDPSRITIFGESAGGLSIYSQLASLQAGGLFERAIAQSGAYADFSPDYRDNIIPIAMAESSGNDFVPSGAEMSTAAGCPDQTTATCLRGLLATTLVTTQVKNKYPTLPVIDGTLLTQTPGDAFNSGNFNRVPVITGNNHDEYRYFVATDYPQPVGNGQYDTLFTKVFGSALELSVEAEYPLSTPTPPINQTELQLSAAGTDGIFVCPARRAERGLAQFVNVWAYEFNDESAPFPATPVLDFPWGAYHSADVQFLLNRIGPPAPAFTADEKTLSAAMISYWTHFAKRGNPNSTSTPHWAPYNSKIDERQSFVPPTPLVESGSDFDTAHVCSLYWDKL
ncbi:MAG: carboxylesterase family protein [Acidobacteriia bacterium]|nr:carboxylesterase family protein [Terriglobia bacterium]